MTKSPRSYSRFQLAALAVAIPALASLAGCNSSVANKVLGKEGPVLTARGEALAQAAPQDVSASYVTRDWPARTVGYCDVCTEHPTLYLAQTAERRGSDDGYFKTWDRAGALDAATAPFVFLGQTLLLPIDLALTPPWNTQCSHGGLPRPAQAHALVAIDSGMTANEGDNPNTPCSQPCK